MAGVLGMCAAVPSRVSGKVATEVEGTAMMGESPGYFGCGPGMMARYAGGAARVRIAENDARILGQGFSGEGAVGLVRETYTCKTDCYEEENLDQAAIADTWMDGAHLRGAYSSENVSIHLGLSSYGQYESDPQPKKSFNVFPDIEVGAGSTGRFRILAGLGTPTLGSLRYPGLYLGGDFAIGEGELQARIGLHRTGPTTSLGARTELIGYIPVASPVDVRVGAALMQDASLAGGEGQLGVRLRF